MSDYINIASVIKKAGYVYPTPITDSLQGSVWRSVHISSNKRVVIKATNIDLHNQRMMMYNGRKYKIYENILMENDILKYLFKDKKCPNSIIQHIETFKSDASYFLVMEDGGDCLLDFVTKIHKVINIGKLDIFEWNKLAKIMFKQMIECIDYIHSKNVCHFDISLENFLINDVKCYVEHTESIINGQKHYAEKIRFCVDERDSVQIKLCDFGLAQLFEDKSGLDGVEDINKFQSNKYCGKPNYQSPEITHQKRTFSAKSNDIFGLGACLFMMIFGISPWERTSVSDPAFQCIMNGGIIYLLTKWNKIEHVNKDLIQLFRGFFQYEEKRINLETLKKCGWINGKS